MAPAMHESVADNEEPPSHFGRYAVVRELGQGGMARVFEGWHVELGSRVALKVMQRVLAVQQLAAARFLREAKTASQIRHPNVVQVFDIGTQDGLPFIVMEFLEGVDLATWLGEKGPLPLSTIVDIFLPVVSAVASAHAAGIIHRDLKPANVMITQRQPHAVYPMILDFGISKIANNDLEDTFTRSDSLLGTAHYMAPELTRGAKFATAASDQYALGVMLYECATGQRPFAGTSQYELMHAIVTAPVPAPSTIRSGIPAEFDALVARAMHRNPAERFSSVTELGSALLSFGERTAWTLWKSEFMVQARDSGGSSHQRTMSDGPPPQGVKSAVRLDAADRGARHSRWLLAGLAAYALAMTLLAWRRPSGTSSAATEGGVDRERLGANPSVTSTPATTSPGVGVATRTELAIADTSVGAEHMAADSNLRSAVERPPTTTAGSADPPVTIRPSLRPSKARTAEPAQPSGGNTVRSVPPAASVEPRPTVTRGSNGALIVD